MSAPPETPRHDNPYPPAAGPWRPSWWGATTTVILFFAGLAILAFETAGQGRLVPMMVGVALVSGIPIVALFDMLRPR